MDKKLKTYAAWVLVFVALSLINGGKLFYLITFTLIAVLVLGFWILHSNKKHLITAFYINEQIVHVGDPLHIEYKLANNSLLPIGASWVQIRMSKKLGNMDYTPEFLFFKPLQMLTLKKDLHASHRGYYRVGSLQVTLSDPFQLLKEALTYGKDIDLTVYPRVAEIERLKLKPSEYFGSIRISENTHEDFTSIRNIRNYQYGDSIKRIHWKQSAKSADLLVKDFDLSANMKVGLILDGFKENQLLDDFETVEEKLVEVCASLSKYFLRQSIETNLLMTSKAPVRLSGKSIERLEDVLKELIGFSSDGEVDLHKVFSSEYKKMTFGSSLYVITCDLNGPVVEAFVAAAMRSIRVFVVYVKPSNMNQDKAFALQKMLQTHSVTLYIIQPDGDIRQVLEAEV